MCRCVRSWPATGVRSWVMTLWESFYVVQCHSYREEVCVCVCVCGMEHLGAAAQMLSKLSSPSKKVGIPYHTIALWPTRSCYSCAGNDAV